MGLLQKIKEPLQSAAEVADKVKRVVFYFALIGLIASVLIAAQLFSFESSWFWNLIKCGIVLMPVLVISFIWFILNNFSQAPELVSALIEQDAAVSSIDSKDSKDIEKPKGLKGLIGMAKKLRDEDGLGVITDTVSGITILANPLFLLIAFICILLVLLLIVISPLILLF